MEWVGGGAGEQVGGLAVVFLDEGGVTGGRDVGDEAQDTVFF